MKFLLIVFAALLILSALRAYAALPEIPEDGVKAQLWKSRRIATIEEIKNNPEKRIPKLFEMLQQLKTLGYRACPERDELINLLESNLLSIPGHATYYQEKIEAMRIEVLANSKKPQEEITRMQEEGLEVVNESHYNSLCVNSFRVLAQLPSPESVAVLGFYLNDPVGRDGKTLLGGARRRPGDDFGPRPINSEQAAIAIRKLGIAHPPFQAPRDNPLDGIFDGEVDAWKDWWNEVKAGKRTYRSIGSIIEYGPDGPASKEAIQRVERDQRRDEEREAGHRQSPIPPAAVVSKRFPVAGILAACALIGAAVWYFLRGRKAA